MKCCAYDACKNAESTCRHTLKHGNCFEYKESEKAPAATPTKLQGAVLRYKNANRAAADCIEMLLSEPMSDRPKSLMDELGATRAAMFELCDEAPAASSEVNTLISDLAGKLSWAAYMTHHLLDGVDLALTPGDKVRLSEQAKEYEQFGADHVLKGKEKAEAATPDISALVRDAEACLGWMNGWDSYTISSRS